MSQKFTFGTRVRLKSGEYGVIDSTLIEESPRVITDTGIFTYPKVENIEVLSDFKRFVDTGIPLFGPDSWYDGHRIKDSMTYKGNAEHQMALMKAKHNDVVSVVEFVDLRIPSLFSAYRRGCTVSVISEHISKSITLPVYLIDAPGIRTQIIMRSNFHNWVLSVITEQQLKTVSDCGQVVANFCQGFSEDWIFPPYSVGAQRFTCEVSDSTQLLVFLCEFLRQTVLFQEC